ncbi:MAG: hypothetical protein IKM73_07910 [Acidaminococcaceae bacterium]|nr:hypothetical protein [Acidaminococcaceae bacterium]
MEGNTSVAELKRLINRLLDRMDERQLRAMYAHANRIYCAGGQFKLLQQASRIETRKQEVRSPQKKK